MALYSWRDEDGIFFFPNLYQSEYLKFLFGQVKEKDHLIGVYCGDEPVRFVANLCWKYSVKHFFIILAGGMRWG